MILKSMIAAAMFVMAMTATHASALNLSFDEFVHGGVVSLPNNPSYQGVIITVENFDNSPGHPDLGVAFDSENEVNTRDPDLERGDGWATGNLAPTTVLGNLLIIQENDTDCGTGVCTLPDDQWANPAGTITLDFSDLKERFNMFQFDIVDIEDISSEDGMVQFFLNGGLVSTYDFADFGANYGAIFGDNSANRIDLGTVGFFDEVVITLGGSGGIGNVVANVPEPSTLVLSTLGLVGLASAGRRRRR